MTCVSILVKSTPESHLPDHTISQRVVCISPLLCLIASLFPSQMDIDGDMSEALYDKLLELEDKVHRKLKEEKKGIRATPQLPE